MNAAATEPGQADREALAKKLTEFAAPEFARFRLAFPEVPAQSVADASREAQVLALLKWAETAGKPGLEKLAWAADFWNDPPEDFGNFHRAKQGTACFVADTLLVFVHGILGDRFETWDALPVRLLRRAEMDLDVLTFSYPAHEWQKASIDGAAGDLQTVIEQRCRDYLHLFFIVHSTGGLVVKRALLMAEANSRKTIEHAPVLAEADSREAINPLLSSPLSRTRRIFNVTVPHCGGKFFASLGGGAVYRLSHRIIRAYARYQKKKPPIGFNRIVGELRWRHPKLICLEKEYITRLGACDTGAVPRPISVELLARSDAAIAEFKVPGPDGKEIPIRTDATQIILRGTHGDVKKPTPTTGGLIVDVIGNQFKDWPRGADIEVAQAYLRELGAQDRDMERLIGDRCEAVSSHPRFPRAQAAGQAAVFHWLRRDVHDGRRRILVTGDAGLGKTTVLHWLTRSLAARHLSGDVHRDPLALYIPMPQIELSNEVVKELRMQEAGIWPGIVEVVTRRLCGITPPQRLRPDKAWLETRLRQRPTVLILDSIDEFLSKHPGLRIDDISRALLAVEKIFANPSLVIVLGVRSTLPRLTELIPGKRDLMYCLQRLTRAQAIASFPKIEPVFAVANESMHDLLLTPLILAAFNLAPGVVDPTKLATRSEIMEQALVAVINGKDLPKEVDGTGDPISTTRWLDALSLIGWLFFSEMRGKMDKDAICHGNAKLGEGWRQHLEKSGQEHPAESLMAGFALAANNDLLLKLLLLTVFATTSDGDYRFRHLEWEDYLASRYLTQCIRCRFADPLGLRSSTMDMLEWVGQQLQPGDITDQVVEGFFEAGVAAGNEFIVANFVVILGNSLVSVSKSILESTFDLVANVTPLARHAAYNTLAARALRNHEKDHHAAVIRDVVHRRMAETDLQGYVGINPLTQRLIWCFLAAFKERFGLGQGPSRPWAGAEYSPEDQQKILEILRDDQKREQVQRRKDSLQIAFLRIQNYILIEKDRSISAIFYLYPITFAFLEGIAVDEVREQLPLVLKDQRLKQAIDSYTLVPQLSEIRTWCARLVDQKVGPMP